jgi:hypothetical protein
MNRQLYERQVKSLYPHIDPLEMDRKWRKLMDELRDLEGIVPEEIEDEPGGNESDDV